MCCVCVGDHPQPEKSTTSSSLLSIDTLAFIQYYTLLHHRTTSPPTTSFSSLHCGNNNIIWEHWLVREPCDSVGAGDVVYIYINIQTNTHLEMLVAHTYGPTHIHIGR